MTELTLDELREQEVRIEPWVQFILTWEGSEVGDKYQALEAAVGACISANDYDTAKAILDRMEADIKDGVENGWIEELAGMAQEEVEAPVPERERMKPEPMNDFRDLAKDHAL